LLGESTGLDKTENDACRCVFAGNDGSFLCQLSAVDEFRGSVVTSQSLQPPPQLLLTAQKLDQRNFFSVETSATGGPGRHDAFGSVGQLQLPYTAAQPITATSW